MKKVQKAAGWLATKDTNPLTETAETVVCHIIIFFMQIKVMMNIIRGRRFGLVFVNTLIGIISVEQFFFII